MIRKKETSSLIKPLWLKTNEEEMKKIVAQLAEKNSPARIGLILRDQYGIPTTKVYGKKLGEYLAEMGIKKNFERENAEKKLENLEEHFKKNITDKKSKHKLQKAHGRTTAHKRYSEKIKK